MMVRYGCCATLIHATGLSIPTVTKVCIVPLATILLYASPTSVRGWRTIPKCKNGAPMAHLISTRPYFDYFLSLTFSLSRINSTCFAQSCPLRDHLNLVPRKDTNTIASNDIGSNFFFSFSTFPVQISSSMCPWLSILVRWGRGLLRTQIPSPASSEISVLVFTSKCFF